MLVFGLIVTVADRDRVLAEGVPCPCPECGHETPHLVVEAFRLLALFLIPVWRYRKHYYLVCDPCGHMEPVPREEAAALGRAAPQPY
jgi:uncharacterized Zn finger protein